MNENFEDLLKVIPRIAEAIKGFASEDLQKQAFNVLVKAYGQASLPTEGDDAKAEGANGSQGTEKRAARGKTSKTSIGFIKDLDLNPKGKESFEDFVNKKQPKSDMDKYALIVYYLEHIAELKPVSIEHVNSVFRLTKGWKEPTNIKSSLAAAASKTGTINTSNLSDLKTTPAGRNLVDRDLPRTKK